MAQGSLPMRDIDPGGSTIYQRPQTPLPAVPPPTLQVAVSGPISQPTGHFDDAMQALSLTPQEQYLYQHHLKNLMGSGSFTQPGGETSTVLQTNVQGPDGRYYNIPTVWFGQQLPLPLARIMAAQAGWDKWPAYADPGEAERRYYDMHQYISRDLGLIGR